MVSEREIEARAVTAFVRALSEPGAAVGDQKPAIANVNINYVVRAALEAAARVRAEANAESKPEQVPSGWKLVPEEPTEEMYRAVYKVQDDCAIHNYGASPTFDDYWSAALSASPAAPTAGGGE